MQIASFYISILVSVGICQEVNKKDEIPHIAGDILNDENL